MSMQYNKRRAHQMLLSWKERSNRKPLLLRGARQVGKTTLVNMLAESFDSYIYLNMEKRADREIFEKADTIGEILNAAYLLKGIAMPTGKKAQTLLFIDEIQEAPVAIHQLRYFYEERPDLFVIAAGSLLEFALSKVPGFPVGRVEYLCLHPFDFEEYLMALGNQAAIEQLNAVPVAGFAHDILLRLFHEYAIIGGMPEVIREYAATGNMAHIQPIYEQIWQSYREDVEKYARNDTDRKVIRHVIDTAPQESDRIKFEKFGQSHYRSREVGEALRTLDMAKIIQLVYPTTNVIPPLKTDYKKRPRLQFLDTGLLNHAMGIQGDMIGLKDLNDFFRGRIIQQLVTQQLISIHDAPTYKPHFWVRERPDATAEVDLVYSYKQHIIPIEIKSGKQGRLRSLHQFIERCNHVYAIRLSANRFSVEATATPGGKSYLLLNLPYYLSVKLPLYAEWFVDNHKL